MGTPTSTNSGSTVTTRPINSGIECPDVISSCKPNVNDPCCKSNKFGNAVPKISSDDLATLA